MVMDTHRHPNPLEPTSGDVLFEQEVRRRDALGEKCTTGCRELDEAVLCGGFERGYVVGISAEEERVGLVVALQTMARLFVAGNTRLPRAMIITTLAMTALLPLLRDVFLGQLATMRDGRGKDQNEVLLKEFLTRIEVARVFDIPGLWEVLGELDHLANSEDQKPEELPKPEKMDEEYGGHRDVVVEAVATEAQEKDRGETQICAEKANPEEYPRYLSSSPLSDPPSSPSEGTPWETTVLRERPPGQRKEIQDSEEEDEEEEEEDEGAFTSPRPLTRDSPKSCPGEEEPGSVPDGENLSATEEPMQQERASATPEKPAVDQSAQENDSSGRDIILITHMSTLLSTLFHQREKATAHQTLQLLSSQLRYLTRAPEYGSPLVIILNSTTSSPDTNTTSTSTTNPDRDERPPPDNMPPNTINRPLDTTLQSIFSPPPLPVSGPNYAYDTPHPRRNKPSYGLIFTQMLDLHLLCTLVPKTRVDSEALSIQTTTTAVPSVQYSWVVEVLLDDVGVWEGRGAVEGGRPRIWREQRWGAVEVKRDGAGVRVVDAF